MNNENTKQSLHLPKEIIEEILSKLPVKLLLRFRCISKSWRSLIGSERFIKTHLENSRKNTTFPHHRVIFNCNGLKQCSVDSFLNDSFTNPSTFDDPTYYSWSSARVVSCCNGLVCIIIQSRHFFFWNPSTKMSKKLPEIDHVNSSWCISSRGFGWNETGGEFKIFAAVCDPNRSIGKVYSSKTNSWKTVRVAEDVSRMCKTGFGRVKYKDLDLENFEYQHVGQLVKGKLHWLMRGEYNDNIIVWFDLQREVFGMIDQKTGTRRLRGSPSLGVLGGCLCMLSKGNNNGPKQCIDVWVMKEYGVKGSWEKLMALPCVLDLDPFPPSNHTEIFLFCGSTFLIYNLQDNVFTLPNRINCFNKAYLYVESLISPNIVAWKY